MPTGGRWTIEGGLDNKERDGRTKSCRLEETVNLAGAGRAQLYLPLSTLSLHQAQ